VTDKKSQLGIILLTIFIDMVGFGIVIPVLPLYAQHFGASSVTNGFLVGIYSAVQFIVSPLIGKLSDRVGRRPVLIFSVLGTAIGFALMGAATTVAMLFVARIIDGVSGGNIGTAQAYIADITTPEERSGAMGFIGAAFGLGFIFGPAIGGLLSGHFGYSAPFYFAAALALFNALLIYLRLPESLDAEHRAHPAHRQRIVEVLQHSQRSTFTTVIAIYFFLITGFSIMTALYALFMHNRFGLDARHTGYIFAFIGIIGVLIQGGMIRRLVPKYGERILAAVGAFVLAVSLFVLPFSSGMAVLLVASGGIAVGNSFLTPTINGLLSRSVDKRWQGRALGLMQSSGSLGRAVGPALAGWLATMDLAERYGHTPFFVSGTLLVVAFVLVLTLFRASHEPLSEAVEPSRA
jgi:multidrug resistance protein